MDQEYKTKFEVESETNDNKDVVVEPEGPRPCPAPTALPDPRVLLFQQELEVTAHCFNGLNMLGNEGRLRVVGHLWDYFQLDDFKREKQLAIQRALKEASK